MFISILITNSYRFSSLCSIFLVYKRRKSIVLGVVFYVISVAFFLCYNCLIGHERIAPFFSMICRNGYDIEDSPMMVVSHQNEADMRPSLETRYVHFVFVVLITVLFREYVV
jgi:hypothetical protein